MSANLIDVNDANFQTEILEAGRPALVDFWAPWCGPCKAIGPLVAKLAEKYGAEVRFAKMNVDESPITPSRYGIKAIPTLLFFNGGKLVDQIVGMVGAGQIEATLRKIQSGEDLAPPFQMQ
ncbi:MAG: thioredoxin [Desulfobacteraceae bacterium]|jgi:thioredoxin 1|nr:thioredoxin [Desulfobacteraceae bacterium]